MWVELQSPLHQVALILAGFVLTYHAVIVGRQAHGGKAWLFPEGWDGKRVPLELNSGFSLNWFPI